MGDFSIAALSLVGCVLAASAVTKLRSPRAYRAFREGLRETGVAPGRVDSPPTSTTSQPASKCALPRSTASAVARVRESGKNESGVTLTMPMTLGLSAMQSDVDG